MRYTIMMSEIVNSWRSSSDTVDENNVHFANVHVDSKDRDQIFFILRCVWNINIPYPTCALHQKMIQIFWRWQLSSRRWLSKVVQLTKFVTIWLKALIINNICMEWFEDKAVLLAHNYREDIVQESNDHTKHNDANEAWECLCRIWSY